MKNSNIIHHPAKQLFTLALNDSNVAYIQYQLKNGVYRLVHSEVPSHLRGKGIGKRLIEKTVDHLKVNQLKAKAICSYIRSVVSRNEEWQSIINL